MAADDSPHRQAAVDRAQVYRLFAAAMDLDPSARDGFIRERCSHDPALLCEVAALVAAIDSDPDLAGLFRSG